MKNFFNINSFKTLPVVVFLMLFMSCSTSYEKQLSGRWEAFEYTVNGVDQLVINGVTMDFNADGSFVQTLYTGENERTETGEWSYNKSEQTFVFNYERSEKTVTWVVVDIDPEIIHMTNNETKGFYVEWKFKKK